MAQDGEVNAERRQSTPMPAAIAKALIKAIKEGKSAFAATPGEDAAEARQFKYASINDVLEAAHDTLNNNGLTAIPIEVAYSEDVVDLGGVRQILARYGYRFRLVHETGVSWVDEDDTRHISIYIAGSGMSAGKAQSLALRDYLKGLLRIRTSEPEIEDSGAAPAVAKPEPVVKLGMPKGPATMPFVFGPEDGKGGGLKPYTATQVKELFDKIVAPLPKAKRAEWEEANAQGLKQLHEVNGKIALQIRRVLDQE